nr:centrosomal protein of 135 kda [Hymenolepis microstoma]
MALNSGHSPSQFQSDKFPVKNLPNTLSVREKDFQSSIMLLQAEKELMEKKAEAFKKQIKYQEEEIERLRGLLDNREYNIDNNNLQDSQKRDFLSIIERLQSKVDNLQIRNSELEQRLLLQMDAASNDSAVGTSSSNILFARERSTQCGVRTKDSSMNKFELSELLDNFEKANRHFVKRTDELLNSQKQLVLEVDRLNGLLPPSKRSTATVKRNPIRPVVKRMPSGSSESSSKNNSAANSSAKASENVYASPIKEYIEGLIADREVMLAQVECLNRSLRRLTESDSGVIAINTPYPLSSSNSGGKNGSPRLDRNQNAYTQTSVQESPLVINGRGDYISETLRAILKDLESERDHYKHKSEELQFELRRILRSTSRLRQSFANVDMDTDLETAKRERSELQAMLNKFERNLLEIQEEVRLLKSERDQLLLQLEQIEAEKSKGQLQTALLQTQSQNSALVNELMTQKNMYNESVRGQQLSNSALSEARHDLQVLNSRIKELETELKRSKDEIGRLQAVASELSAENDNIRSSLDDRTEDAVFLKQELTKTNKLLNEKMKYLENVEKHLRQVTEMTADKDHELHLLTERLRELETSSKVVSQCRNISEQKYAKAQSDMTVLAAEVESLKLRLQSASTEKNELQSRLTEAMHGLAHSEQAMDMKLKEHKDLLVQYGSLSKDFDELTRKNRDLERNLTEIEGVLKGKEADLRDQLDRAQKAEVDALNAKRESSALEEKCAQLYAAAEKAEIRAALLEGEFEEVRRQLMATRDIASALQTQLDHSDEHSVSAFAANNDLSGKLAECELKLKDALIEISHQRKLVSKLEVLLTSARENQSRLQDLLDNKNKECEILRKTRDATPSNDLEISLDKLRPKHLPSNHHINTVAPISPVAMMPTAHSTPRDQIEIAETNKLFYNRVEPSLTSVLSSTSDISSSSFHSRNSEHSSPPTMKVTQTYEPGTNDSSVKFYKPKSISEIFTDDQLPSTELSKVNQPIS